MSPHETADLLRYAASLDRWLKETDPESAQMMVAGWSSMLGEVPLDWAQRAVRDHYAQPEARTIMPGDLLHGWLDAARRDRQREQDAAHRVEVQKELSVGDAVPTVFGSATQYLTDMMAAVARGEDPSTVVRPAGVRVLNLSPEADARSRACRFPSICLCTHLECRDGWLDQDGVRVNSQGKSYPAAQRCPMCEEGMVMAQERGVARRPRRATAGR